MAEKGNTPRTGVTSGDNETLARFELDSGKPGSDGADRLRSVENADLSGDIRLNVLRDAPYWHLGDDTVYFIGATTVYVAPTVSITDLTFTRDGDDLIISSPTTAAVRLDDVFSLGSDELPAVAVEEGLISVDRVLEIMRNGVESIVRVEAIQFTNAGVELTLGNPFGDGLIGTVVLGADEFADPDSDAFEMMAIEGTEGSTDSMMPVREEGEETDLGSAPTDMLAGTLGVLENSLSGTLVGRVHADDADGDSITYTLTNDAGGRFSIDSSTGDIRVANSSILDFEAAGSHTVSVLARDSSGFTISKNFAITLKDVVEALDGDAADNLLTALHGMDIVRGHGGDDTLFGGAGNDTLQGGTGSDVLYGDEGDDVIDGGADDDQIIYNQGDGSDTVDGGSGDDTVTVTGSADFAQLYRIEDAATYNARTGESRASDHVIITTDDGSVFIDAVDIESVTINGNHPGDQVLIAGDFTFAGLTNGFNLNNIASVDASALVSDHDVNASANAQDGTFIGGAGDDTISGGAGNDTAVFSGNWSDYTIVDLGAGSYQLTNKIDGQIDIVDGVETYQFADITLPEADILNVAPGDLAIDSNDVAENSAGGTVV
ncbi:MAG: cadherin domain-containing protein, partial [Pseudomonadota bacterium]